MEKTLRYLFEQSGHKPTYLMTEEGDLRYKTMKAEAGYMEMMASGVQTAIDELEEMAAACQSYMKKI